VVDVPSGPSWTPSPPIRIKTNVTLNGKKTSRSLKTPISGFGIYYGTRVIYIYRLCGLLSDLLSY
jgi:hypothetical protein